MGTGSRHRWAIAAAATLMQLALGAVYAWSVFRKPLAAALDTNVTDVNLVFTITNVTLGIAAFVGGLWMTRVGPRVIAITAGVLYGVGVGLSGFATHDVRILYLTYGLVAGAGIGLGYIVPLATLVKWFPDKRGMITGIAVAGFGGGALVFGPISRALIGSIGPFSTFHVLGVVFLVVVVAAGSMMRNPPVGYQPPNWRPRAATDKPIAAPVQYELRGALRTWQWYALWIALFLNVGAGISIIAEAVPMAQEVAGADAVQATALVGTIAIFNGAGRLVWAALSDLIGGRAVFLLLFIVQTIVFLLLPMAGSYNAFLLLACISLLCYGGSFGTMPALVATYFGARNVGRIYGLMLTAWSAGAVLGPMIVSRLRDATGEYAGGLHVIAGIMLVGSIVPIIMHAPGRRTIEADVRVRGRVEAAVAAVPAARV